MKEKIIMDVEISGYTIANVPHVAYGNDDISYGRFLGVEKRLCRIYKYMKENNLFYFNYEEWFENE